jgi:purine-binding chemotaxis protein CheW
MSETATVQKKEVSEELLQLVTFGLGSEEFAIDILKVQEINKMVEITTVPKSPHFVEGVINLRGKVIPIIDLRKKLNLQVTEYTKDSRIIVVVLGRKIIGLIVDSVYEVLRLPEKTIEPPPLIVAGGIDSQYIQGVGKLEDRLLILLNLDNLFSQEESAALHTF